MNISIKINLGSYFIVTISGDGKEFFIERFVLQKFVSGRNCPDTDLNNSFLLN